MAGSNDYPQILDNLLFTNIFKSFRMAIQPSKLLIAFLAIVIISIVGLVMDLHKTVQTAPGTNTADIGGAPSDSGIVPYPTELHAYIMSPEAARSFDARYSDPSYQVGVFWTLARFIPARFNDAVANLLTLNIMESIRQIAMLVLALKWALARHLIYSTVFLSAVFVIMSLAGGAICRIAALEFARNEKPGFFQGLRFARARIVQLIFSPLAPLICILVIGLGIFILGLVGNIPMAGEILVSLLLGITLLLGFLITLLLVGTVGGFNLMYPAIAFEDSDSFDAISRSFSYIYARPWRMGFYSLLAAVYGAACYVFIYVFTTAMLVVTYLFLNLAIFTHNRADTSYKLPAIWPDPRIVSLPSTFDKYIMNWSEISASTIIFFITTIVFCVVAAYVVSFVFSANTVIYALLRKKVDNTALSDVYVPKIPAQEEQVDLSDLPSDKKEPV
jgi:hypothetical protein